MSDLSAETCRKYAEICKLRAARHVDIEQHLLFAALEKVCEQAAKFAETQLSFEREQKAWPYG